MHSVIGVCGELEGYLYTALISLIQGSRDAFIALRNSCGLPSNCSDDEQWRVGIVERIHDKFQFQYIRKKNSKEREIYEKLVEAPITITQELNDNIEWRNKLAHKVPFMKNYLSV